MQDEKAAPKMVAPGYPAIETIRQIDVSGWEPAAVFTPAESSDKCAGEPTGE